MAGPSIQATVRYAADVAELKRNIAEGIGVIDAMKQSVDRTATSLGGQGLLMQANKLTAAIDQLGGITKLTAAEQERATATLDKAIEKYKVMGMTAPPALVETRDRLKEVASTTETSLGEFVKGIPLVEGFIGAFSAEKVLEFAKGIVESVSRIEDLSLATGVSTKGIQQLAYVGTEFGLDVDTMARGVEQLSAKLANGDKNATSAMAMLGLNTKDLLAMGPEEAFLTFAAAAGRVEDPMLKAGIVTEALGGKLGKVLLPVLTELRKKMDEAPIISDPDIKRIHDADVAWQHLLATAKVWFVEVAKFPMEIGRASFLPTNVPNPNAGPARTADIELPTDTINRAKALANELNDLRQKAMEPLSAEQQKHILELKEWGKGEDEISKKVGSSVEAVHLYLKAHEEATAATKKAEEAARRFAESTKNLTTDAIGAAKGFGMLGHLMSENTQTLGDVRDQLDPLDASVNEFHNGISIAGDTLSTVTIPMFSKLPNVVAQNTAEIDKARESTSSWLDAFKKFPDIITAALTGGGGLGGALKGFSNEITKNLFGDKGAWSGITKAVSGWAGPIGEALGGMLPGLGGIVSSLIGKLFSIGGPSKQELEGRQAEGQFENQMGGVVGIQKALMDAGLSADQANAKIQALWAAEKQGADAVKTSIGAITGVIDQHKADVQATTDHINALKQAVQTAGGTMPKDLRDTITSLATMKGLTEDQKKAIQDLAAAADPSFDDLTKKAAGYGITLEQLGPKFQQANIDKLALQYSSDFNQLIEKGADANGVLAGMGSTLSKFVQDAIKSGSSVPESMKNILQAAADTGNLFDDNGKKIKDLNGISWEKTPLDKGTTAIVDAIKDLKDTLEKLPGVVDDVTSKIPHNPFKDWIPPPMPPIPDAPGASTGGLVTPFGIQHFAGGGKVLPFQPRGTDTVPAMLTPGEMVLTHRQQAAVFGRRGGTTVVDFSELKAQLEGLRQLLAAQRRDLTRVLPASIGTAIRDNLAQMRGNRLGR